MQNIYDKIGDQYAEHRSAEIGVGDLLPMIKSVPGPVDVLDLGCGDGRPLAMALRPLARNYVGIDNSSYMASAFKHRIPDAEVIVSSLECADYAEHSFNFIFAYGSIFHLDHDQQVVALEKAAAVLRPGGIFVFNSSDERGNCNGNVAGEEIPHWSLSKSEYIDVLSAQGLTFIEMINGQGDNLIYKFKR